MDDKQIRKLLTQSMFLWKTMNRKCKHCGKYNKYRYRWCSPNNKEVFRLARALGAAIEAFNNVLLEDIQK